MTHNRRPEIVIGEGSTLWAFNELGTEVWRLDVGHNICIRTCHVTDITGNRKNELVLGMQDLTNNEGLLSVFKLEGIHAT